MCSRHCNTRFPTVAIAPAQRHHEDNPLFVVKKVLQKFKNSKGINVHTLGHCLDRKLQKEDNIRFEKITTPLSLQVELLPFPANPPPHEKGSTYIGGAGSEQDVCKALAIHQLKRNLSACHHKI